jgi:hypothetical protein
MMDIRGIERHSSGWAHRRTWKTGPGYRENVAITDPKDYSRYD